MNQVAGMDISMVVMMAAFGISIGLLDAFDISLPRGDSISMAGPLVAAAVILVGLWPALFLGITGLLVSWLIVRPRSKPYWAVSALLVRTISTLTAGLVLALVIRSGVSPAFWITMLVPLAYLGIELTAQQLALAIESGRRLSTLLRGSVSRQAPVAAAELSASALVVVTYPGMGPWALIPVVALLLLIRQSWAMLLKIRDTYRTTMTVLVDAAVAENPALDGHAERTATIARTIGGRLAIGSKDLERLGYAALLHDIDGIHQLEANQQDGQGFERRCASDVVKDVVFLRDVIPVLQVSDGVAAMGDVDDTTLLLGLLVLIASAADAYTHPAARRPNDMALILSVSSSVPRRLKAKAAAAALDLGYQLPALK